MVQDDERRFMQIGPLDGRFLGSGGREEHQSFSRAPFAGWFLEWLLAEGDCGLLSFDQSVRQMVVLVALGFSLCFFSVSLFLGISASFNRILHRLTGRRASPVKTAMISIGLSPYARTAA
jgi:hypothetical protein